MPTSATVYTTWLCKCQGTRKTAQKFGDAERTLWTTAEKAGILRRNLPVLQTLAHKSHTGRNDTSHYVSDNCYKLLLHTEIFAVLTKAVGYVTLVLQGF